MPSAIGSAVHAGVERVLKRSPLRPVEALRSVFYGEVEKMSEPEEAPAAALADAERMLDLYITAAKDFSPTMIEKPFIITVNNIHFSGVIDAADEDLHDLKTRAGKTIGDKRPSRFDVTRYIAQLSGYVLGYEHLTHRRPRKVFIDLLDRKPSFRRIEIQPDINEFVEMLELVSSNIERGNFEVSGPANGTCRFCEYSRNGACSYAVLD